jgi:hypothetical protein
MQEVLGAPPAQVGRHERKPSASAAGFDPHELEPLLQNWSVDG